MENWTICFREAELGMFLIKCLFSLEVPHFSKGKEKGQRKRKGRTDLFENT